MAAREKALRSSTKGGALTQALKAIQKYNQDANGASQIIAFEFQTNNERMLHGEPVVLSNDLSLKEIAMVAHWAIQKLEKNVGTEIRTAAELDAINTTEDAKINRQIIPPEGTRTTIVQ